MADLVPIDAATPRSRDDVVDALLAFGKGHPLGPDLTVPDPIR